MFMCGYAFRPRARNYTRVRTGIEVGSGNEKPASSVWRNPRGKINCTEKPWQSVWSINASWRSISNHVSHNHFPHSASRKKMETLAYGIGIIWSSTMRETIPPPPPPEARWVLEMLMTCDTWLSEDAIITPTLQIRDWIIKKIFFSDLPDVNLEVTGNAFEGSCCLTVADVRPRLADKRWGQMAS